MDDYSLIDFAEGLDKLAYYQRNKTLNKLVQKEDPPQQSNSIFFYIIKFINKKFDKIK